jgi:hypothetical protein
MVPGGGDHLALQPKRKDSSSFLKKRTKKLLLITVRSDRGGRVNQLSKSFLVLVFKKELLSCFPAMTIHPDAREEPSSAPGRGPPDFEWIFKKLLPQP